MVRYQSYLMCCEGCFNNSSIAISWHTLSGAELFSREVASLNEFRKFFGLKTHDTFESINPDPEISDLLRKLYDSPDMVELYPGLFVEDAKPRRDPGSGFNAPYTVGRAVLSDAVTLVRGDRFYTLVFAALLH